MSATLHFDQRDARHAGVGEHRQAILHGGRGPARLRWFEPTWGSAALVPGIPRIWHVEAGRRIHDAGPVDERLAGLARRHAARAQELRRLLAPDTLQLGPRAFCDLARDADEGGTVFSQMWLGEHEHYVRTRGLTRLRGGAREVTVVTGVCLFSSRAVSLETADGRELSVVYAQHGRLGSAVRAISEDPRLTLYELEASTRLARFIADLVAALPPGPPVAVKIDVPRVQYYLYLLDLLDAEMIDPDLLLHWFELVDHRRERVVAFYRDALQRRLATTGAPREVVIAETEGLDRLIGTLSAAVRAGAAPNVGALVGKLCESDRTWRCVCDVAAPSSYVDLGYLSYAVELLRVRLSCEAEDGPVTVAVENRHESRIYERALRLAKALRWSSVRNSLLALFPLERALTAGDESGVLYSDPGQRFVDALDRSYTPSALIDALYGRVR